MGPPPSLGRAIPDVCLHCCFLHRLTHPTPGDLIGAILGPPCSHLAAIWVSRPWKPAAEEPQSFSMRFGTPLPKTSAPSFPRTSCESPYRLYFKIVFPQSPDVLGRGVEDALGLLRGGCLAGPRRCYGSGVTSARNADTADTFRTSNISCAEAAERFSAGPPG